MSKQSYHTEALPPWQEEDLNDEAWNELVQTRFPANLEEQARGLKAWSRQRKLGQVTDLLRALLVYAACQYSFRELGMWAVLKGLGSLSERAWRKRLQRSEAWIKWLLYELLGIHQRAGWLPKAAGRVLIVDATRWKTPAGTGDDVRLHQCYDLQAGCMQQVEVTDGHQAEGLGHFAFGPGDLVMTDAGYPVGCGVEETQKSQSWLLQRVSAYCLRLEDEQGAVISLKKQVQGQPNDSLKEVQGWVRLPKSGKRAQVRLLCFHLPEKQAKAARERKENTLRKKHGSTYNRELVWWAGWVLLVSTTEPGMWSGMDLVRLSRARWHIELFFQRLKQCLRLHQLDFKDWQRARILVHLSLIVWWLHEQEAHWMRELLSGTLTAPEAQIRVLAEPEETDAQTE
jgi:Transposase DDE domain